MTSILDLRHVGMTYATRSGQRVTALEDVSLTIGDNEFVTIVGPSGCGKSTLLKLFARIMPATSGTIAFRGRPLAKPSPDIGFCFQQPLLFPWRTIEENVLFPIEMLGRPLATYRERARELIALVGLEGFERSYPRELSGGMQQRAAICRALITDPPLLLMDEPFAALDAMTREELAIELLRIWSRKKKAVVFVTHSISESVLLADRVITMSPRPGRIDQIIPIDLPRPRDISMVSTPAFGHYTDLIRGRIVSTRKAA